MVLLQKTHPGTRFTSVNESPVPSLAQQDVPVGRHPVPLGQRRLRRHRSLRRVVLPHLSGRVSQHAEEHHGRIAGHRVPARARGRLSTPRWPDQVGQGLGDVDQQRARQLVRDRHCSGGICRRCRRLRLPARLLEARHADGARDGHRCSDASVRFRQYEHPRFSSQQRGPQHPSASPVRRKLYLEGAQEHRYPRRPGSRDGHERRWCSDLLPSGGQPRPRVRRSQHHHRCPTTLWSVRCWRRQCERAAPPLQQLHRLRRCLAHQHQRARAIDQEGRGPHAPHQ